MIRTFLIYRMIDTCLDMLFERIESVFVPIEGLRIGDRYRKIVFRAGPMDMIRSRVVEYHDCEVEGYFSGGIWMKVRMIEGTFRFSDASTAKKFVKMNPSLNYNDTGNDLEVSFYSYPSTTVSMIRDVFFRAEKIK